MYISYLHQKWDKKFFNLNLGGNKKMVVITYIKLAAANFIIGITNTKH